MTLRAASAHGQTKTTPADQKTEPAKKTSTAAERQGWALILHRLEDNPADPVVAEFARQAFIRIVEVSDFRISVCPSYGELPEKYQKKHPLIILYTLAIAAYQIETRDKDEDKASVYALQSVLKGYASILRADPKATDKKLDELVRMNAGGKLPELVMKKSCKAKASS